MAARTRHATTADLGELIRLNSVVQRWHAETYPAVFKRGPQPGEARAFFTDQIAVPDKVLIVSEAAEGTPPTGYLLATLKASEGTPVSHPDKRLHVEHIVVAPEARRAGHARALMQRAETIATEVGCTGLSLDSWEANTDAHAFFVSCGYALRRYWFHKPLM